MQVLKALISINCYQLFEVIIIGNREAKMERANKLKINVSKKGAELIRAERKLLAIKESMQMALSLLMTTAGNVNMAKEQIRRIKQTCHVIHKEIKEMEEQARMEESLHKNFIV